MSENVEVVLERVRTLSDYFRSRAEITDQATHPPVEHLSLLAEAGLFRVPIAAELGGLGASARMWEVTETVARGCGVTTFLQMQHLSALNLVARSANDQLKQSLLPEMMDGRRWVGVAISHLRRPDHNVHAVWEGSNLIVEGQVPWFTGWGMMDSMVLAAALPDQQIVYLWVSTENLVASAPMRVCAMTACSNVSLELGRLSLAEDNVVSLQTRADMERGDTARALRHSAQPLGIVQAAVTLLRGQRAERAATSFEQRAAAIRTEASGWDGDAGQAYRLRARSNALALEAGQAAVFACGGRAMKLDHPAQRIVREALFYCITQLDAGLRSTALDLLATGSG